MPNQTLRALCNAAASNAGVDALREAGHEGGATMYRRFKDWLRDEGHPEATELSLEDFSSRASEFFEKAGWGAVTLRSANDAFALIEIRDCWEEGANQGRPGCHVTTGALAGFLSPLADYPMAVMEVQCGRSADDGAGTCRFLAGNEQMLDEAYQRLVAGESWESIGAETVE